MSLKLSPACRRTLLRLARDYPGPRWCPAVYRRNGKQAWVPVMVDTTSRAVRCFKVIKRKRWRWEQVVCMLAVFLGNMGPWNGFRTYAVPRRRLKFVRLEGLGPVRTNRQSGRFAAVIGTDQRR